MRRAGITRDAHPPDPLRDRRTGALTADSQYAVLARLAVDLLQRANRSPSMGKSRTGQDFRDASHVKVRNAIASRSTDQARGPRGRRTGDLLARRTALPARAGHGPHPLGDHRAVVARALRRAFGGVAADAPSDARRRGAGAGSVAGAPRDSGACADTD